MASVADTSGADVVALECASVTFAVLGRLLYGEPKSDRIAQLLEGDFFIEIPFGAASEQVITGQNLLEQWVLAAQTKSLPEVVAELNSEWLRLMVGYGEPEAPPWATYYFEKDPLIFGRKTLEVRSWYARYGLEIERKHHEPDDHLGLMLQFLAALILRQSEALQTGDYALAKELASEQHKFLTANVLPWVSHWRALVVDAAKNPFYPGLACLIDGSLKVYTA